MREMKVDEKVCTYSVSTFPIRDSSIGIGPLRLLEERLLKQLTKEETVNAESMQNKQMKFTNR